jgi:TPR repeat protein
MAMIFGVLAASWRVAKMLGAGHWVNVAAPIVALAGELALGALFYLRDRAEAREAWEEMLLAPPQRVSEALEESHGMWSLGVEQEAYEALTQLPESPSHAPYIRRDAHEPLCERLHEAAAHNTSTLVVVCGPSKSGKSRLLWEAAREVLSEAWLLRPRSAVALGKLARQGPPRMRGNAPCVIWLDDIERFLGEDVSDGLCLETMSGFERWPRPVIVLGARGGKGAARSRGRSGAYYDPLDDLIERYPEPLWLRPGLTDGELVRLRSAGYPKRAIELIASLGIGAFMIAAPRLVSRLELEQDNIDGVAAVRATIDWRRMGILRPIPRSALLDLLAESDPRWASRADDALERALAWAMEPLYASVALLARVPGEDGEAYEPYDYLVAHTERSGPPVAPASWRYVVEHGARIDELATNVGFAALAAGGDRAFGSASFRRADERGSAIGACNLGVLLWRFSDSASDPAERDKLLDEAEDALRRAGGRGDTGGASNLALLLEWRASQTSDEAKREQLLAEADSFHRQAYDGSDTDTASNLAASNLGVFLEEQANLTQDQAKRRQLFKESEQVLRKADTAGSAIAAFNLGNVLLHKAERSSNKAQHERLLVESERAFERAGARGYAGGSFNLGLMLADRVARTGDDSDRLLADAIQAFRQAHEGGNDKAMYFVGYTLSKRALRTTVAAKREQLLDEAEQALRHADGLGSVEAPNDLALLLRHRAEQIDDRSTREHLFAEAEEAFRRADERGSVNGASNLASLLTQRAVLTTDASELRRLDDETMAVLRRLQERISE